VPTARHRKPSYVVEDRVEPVEPADDPGAATQLGRRGASPRRA